MASGRKKKNQNFNFMKKQSEKNATIYKIKNRSKTIVPGTLKLNDLLRHASIRDY